MKLPRFTIHSIHADDVPDIIAIADDCGLSPWSEKDYADEAQRDDATLVKLTTAETETAGFIVGRRVLSAQSEDEVEAEIYNIGVAKRFQRMGCGTLLLQEFLDRCASHQVRYVWLDVRISNAAAITFYKGFGFSEYIVRPRFYSHPDEDGMVMRLTLGDGRR